MSFRVRGNAKRDLRASGVRANRRIRAPLPLASTRARDCVSKPRADRRAIRAIFLVPPALTRPASIGLRGGQLTCRTEAGRGGRAAARFRSRAYFPRARVSNLLTARCCIFTRVSPTNDGDDDDDDDNDDDDEDDDDETFELCLRHRRECSFN